MVIKTKLCNDIYSRYKKACTDMEINSGVDRSGSHTSVLWKLLELSRSKPIVFDNDIISNFKILKTNTKNCMEGRLRFLARCVPKGEEDIEHAIEIEKVKKIYLEMKTWWDRLRQKVRDTEEEVEEVEEFKEELEVDEAGNPNMYAYIEDEIEDIEVEEEEKHKEEEHEPRETLQRRFQRRLHKDIHRENVRRLREQFEETNDEKIAHTLSQLETFDLFFHDNARIKNKKNQQLISFEHVPGLEFSLDQMADIAMAVKLHSEIFTFFILTTSLIRSNRKFHGVSVSDCVISMKRISQRKNLLEMMRFHCCMIVMSYIFLLSPRDEVLDNLDYVAKFDSLLFTILMYLGGDDPFQVIDEKNGISTYKSKLIEVAEKPEHEFKFIITLMKQVLDERLKIETLEQIFNTANADYKNACRLYTSQSFESTTISEEGKMYAWVTSGPYKVIIPCFLKETVTRKKNKKKKIVYREHYTIMFHENYKALVDNAEGVFFCNHSRVETVVERAFSIPNYLFKGGEELTNGFPFSVYIRNSRPENIGFYENDYMEA